MKKPAPQSTKPAASRRVEETRLTKKSASRPRQTAADLRRLQHELEVHHIELEMQNEQLRTTRSHLESALERYTDLYDFAPVGCFNLTADGIIQLVNLTGASLTGTEHGRMPGRRFGLLVAETDRRAFAEFLARCFASETRQSCELALAVDDRPKRFVRLDGTRSPDGLECRVVLQDITEQRLGADVARHHLDETEHSRAALLSLLEDQKITGRALRENEEHVRFLSDLAEATSSLIDPAEIMAATSRLLGEHLRTSHCSYADLEPDCESFTIQHAYRAEGSAVASGTYQLSQFGVRAVSTLSGGKPLIIRDVDAEIGAADGAEMFNAIGIKAIICCPLVKVDGLRAMMAVYQTTPRDWQPREIALVREVVGRCWATIERRRAEENLRMLNTELEQRVVERTAQLQAANHELEAFSYSVSHDLRAPLRGVVGFVRMLEEDHGTRLDPEGRRMLGVVSREARRMGLLIDDLLAFSRLGRQEMKRSPVQMEALARDVIESLSMLGAPSAPHWVLKPLPPAQGDSAMLRQVFVNLLGNAAKFTSRQPAPQIEVGHAATAQGAAYYVRDNGVGFDMAYVDKLFRVFQRLHSEEEFEGTGVGLALVDRIIHRHGGKVWAEGKMDAGATFFFTLPAEPDTTDEQPA